MIKYRRIGGVLHRFELTTVSLGEGQGTSVHFAVTVVPEVPTLGQRIRSFLFFGK